MICFNPPPHRVTKGESEAQVVVVVVVVLGLDVPRAT